MRSTLRKVMRKVVMKCTTHRGMGVQEMYVPDSPDAKR